MQVVAVTVGALQAGTKENVIPDEALIKLNVRTFDEGVRKRVLASIERIVNAFPTDEQPQVRGMLAESLVGVVAQQLLRTADGAGRVAAHEILLGSHAVASMIREGKTYQLGNTMQNGRAQGMQTMDSALERLVRNGIVEMEVALEKAEDKESFRKAFAPGGPETNIDGAK
jgi:twitching motility protein PilT